MCFTQKGRKGKERAASKQHDKKYEQNVNLVTDQENKERSGTCVLCSLTVVKHQRPYQNDRDGLPQTAGHLCLHSDRIWESMCLPLNKKAIYQPARKHSHGNDHAMYTVCDRMRTATQLLYNRDNLGRKLLR